jgi:hemolysin activation/secretion protein
VFIVSSFLRYNQESYFFSHRTSVLDNQQNFMQSIAGGFIFPYGYNYYGINYSDASYRTFIQTPRNKYRNKGGSKVLRLNVDRVIHRTGTSKATVSIGGGYDDYNHYIADYRIEMATYRLSKFDLGISYQKRLESSVLGVNAKYVVGKNENYKKDFGNLSIPTKTFNKISYDVLWIKPLPIKIAQQTLRYQLQFKGQYTANMLVITEKDTVGGLSSVRGFKDYSENADITAIVRNEFILPLNPVESKFVRTIVGDLSIFGAVDVGRYKNYEEKNKRVGVMSGVACGITNSNSALNFSATVAKALESNGMRKFPPVVYFSMALSL